MNATQQKIQSWKIRNKLTRRSKYSPLLEAFRRIHMFSKGDVNSPMVLLEFPSSVKDAKEFFVPYSKEQKRCLNWYKLTEKGKEILRDLDLEWGGEEMNQELFIAL
jgi:hypothetical protein